MVLISFNLIFFKICSYSIKKKKLIVYVNISWTILLKLIAHMDFNQERNQM